MVSLIIIFVSLMAAGVWLGAVGSIMYLWREHESAEAAVVLKRKSTPTESLPNAGIAHCA